MSSPTRVPVASSPSVCTHSIKWLSNRVPRFHHNHRHHQCHHRGASYFAAPLIHRRLYGLGALSAPDLFAPHECSRVIIATEYVSVLHLRHITCQSRVSCLAAHSLSFKNA